MSPLGYITSETDTSCLTTTQHTHYTLLSIPWKHPRVTYPQEYEEKSQENTQDEADYDCHVHNYVFWGEDVGDIGYEAEDEHRGKEAERKAAPRGGPVPGSKIEKREEGELIFNDLGHSLFLLFQGKILGCLALLIDKSAVTAGKQQPLDYPLTACNNG